MKWYRSSHNGKLGSGKYGWIERVLSWKAKSLERFCRRHKLSYCDVYLIDSDGSATINFRAKKSGFIIADGYAFVKSRTK